MHTISSLSSQLDKIFREVDFMLETHLDLGLPLMVLFTFCEVVL